MIRKLEKAVEQVTRDATFISRMNNMNMPIIYKNSEQLNSLVLEMRKTYFDLAKKGVF
jgi:tripartite-type tricarboxylate transporter receptor subunit TctC